MRLRSVARRIGVYWRARGTVATARFLLSRIVRHQQHLVFERVLDSAPEQVRWTDRERVSLIDRDNIDAVLDRELREFLGGDQAVDNLEGVRKGNELFVVAADSEYQHCGYILFETREAKLIGEPGAPPLIACCFTAPEARGRGLYRRALSAEVRHLWERGYRRVIVETSPDNLASRKGIEAADFRLCREVSAWIILNCVVYQKRIEGPRPIRKLILI